MAKYFSACDVRNVDFHHRNGNGSNTIANGYACMRVCPRVKNDPIAVSFLKFIDEFPFYIGLEIGKIHL
jgi:hypothetical protein